MRKKEGKAVKAPTDATQTRVKLVGIGASAGGLEALRELLESLPVSDEFSYVIAQHLSPTHLSMMTELLAPVTQLRVQNLTDDTAPQAKVVYITPPNSDVILSNGLLKLLPPQSAIGPKPSVNHFFNSLAVELGERAIGIILSGTGSDGAAGIRAIKAAQGITIAQEPETAKYDGMPRAAIHTKCIDLILPPSQIGPALDRLTSLPLNLLHVIDESRALDEYENIINLVRLHTAFKLHDYKQATIRRRIARRMSILGLATLQDYVNHLKNNRAESQHLVKDTFIAVTEFFRDREPFELIEQKLHELVKTHNGDVIRCWIPGCSSGEEVYSFAMLLEDALATQQRPELQYMIFASDLDEDALNIARSGLYPATELANIAHTRRDRYMEAIGDHYRVKKTIRNRIVFTRQNVLEDPPFGRMDLVSCRNLLIYFNQSAQKRAIESFHYALKPGGYLLLGCSESIDQSSNLFKTIDSKNRLYQRMIGAIQLVGSITPMRYRSDNTHEQRRNQTTSTDLISMRTLEQLSGRYAPPSLVINNDDQIVHMHGDLKPFLNFPQGKVDMNLFELVIPEVRAELRALVFRCRRDKTLLQGCTHRIFMGNESANFMPIVSPLESANSALLLVSFQIKVVEHPVDTTEDPADKEQQKIIISELEQELANTRVHLNIVVQELESSNEELQSLNEELQSTNEEMQSTNEELQTSNEELQSTNEELLTVNEELQIKSAELEKSANDLNNVKNSLTLPLLVVDQQLRITQYNDACRDIIFVTPPLEGSSINTLAWKIELPGLADKIFTVIKDAEPFESRAQNSDGSVYAFKIMPYRQDHSEVAGAVLIFENITAQIHAEHALVASENRYRQVVESLPQLVWTCQADGPCDYLSPQWVAYTGICEADQLGFGWLEQIHPEDRQRTIDHWMATAGEGLDFEIEFRIRRFDGSYRWFHTLAKPLRDDSGHIIKWFGSNTDIDHTKKAEVLADLNEKRFGLLAANVQDYAIIFLDCNGIIESWNEGAARIHEQSQEAMIGLPMSALFPNDALTHYNPTSLIYAAISQGYVSDEGSLVRNDKSRIYFEVTLNAIKDNAGTLVGFSLLTRDSTERKIAEQSLRDSEARINRIFNIMPEAILVVDQHGQIQHTNYRIEQILGYKQSELIGKPVEILIPARARKSHMSHRTSFIPMATARMMGEGRDLYALHKSGAEILVEVALAPFNENGETFTLVSLIDISKRKVAESELRLAAKVFDNTLDGILIMDNQEIIVKVNPAFEKILGYTSDEIIGQTVNILNSDRQDSEFYRTMWKSIETTGCWQGEVWNRHRDGHVIPVWLSISTLFNQQDQPERYIATLYDISEQKLTQERVNYLAHYDILTGLPNRTLFMDRFGHALNKAKRKKNMLSVLFIDMDNFKHVNDTYGHPAGDKLLCKVAERLQSAVRESDTVSRFSGDEFMVLIEDAKNDDSIQTTARHILNALASPMHFEWGDFFVSASIGIAIFPQDGTETDVLLKNADLAMYRSKEAGRNQLHFYCKHMSEVANNRMLLQNDLRSALDKKELELHYQPIVLVDNQTCIGIEALSRWKHATHGWIAPDKFIALAEEDHLILNLGEWVLRTACQQMSDWLSAGVNLDFVTVNVSGKQIMQSDFASIARSMFNETKCPPDRIVFELTESFVMRESEGAIAKLKLLRDLGAGIAIDDFGTGYSSLSYLKRLPVTKLKLDRSFVRDIPGDPNDIAIARAIMRLGEAVNLEVVAEGVETEEQHRFLIQEGCNYGQGYLYAKPMKPSDTFLFLKQQEQNPRRRLIKRLGD